MVGKRSVATALVTALTAGIVALGASAAGASSSAEAEFVQKINAERSKRGKSTLAVRSDLVAVARRHSARMAAKGDIWHNPNLANEVDGNWTVLGENVGMGPSVDSLHTAFMNSEHHRDNILYGTFNEIGVGVVKDGDTVYVTEVFAHRTSGGSSTVTKSSSGSSASPSYSTATAATPTVAAPAPKRRAPKPKPNTVDTLVRLLDLDSGVVSPRGRAGRS